MLASGAGRRQRRSAGGRHPPGIRRTKAEREQLNDERGVKPLPVSDRQRRSRIGQRWHGKGRGGLLYSIPRNETAPNGLETMPGREPPDIPVPPGRAASHQRDCDQRRTGLTAQGVWLPEWYPVPVVNRCFKSQTLMRVPSVGRGEASTRLPSAFGPKAGCRSSKAVGTTRARYGWCRAQGTHERGDGINLSANGGGWVEPRLHSPAPMNWRRAAPVRNTLTGT